MRKSSDFSIISTFILALILCSINAQTVNFTINTEADVKDISPYIYGNNNHNNKTENNFAALRRGGNRWTGYNWENNASNAGNDWIHFSDNYIPESMGIDKADYETPGIVATTFHNKTLSNKFPYSLITGKRSYQSKINLSIIFDKFIKKWFHAFYQTI